MSVRIAAASALLAVVVTLFYLSRNRSPLEPPLNSFRFEGFVANRRLKPLKSTKTSALLRSEIAAGASVKESSTSKKGEDSSCWKKINSELETQNYLATENRLLRELIGEWYFSNDDKTPVENTPAPEGKFILALARAGLLDGKKIQTNDDEAVKLLDEVSKADPKNSAPLLYAAIIESRRGDKDRAEKLFIQAQQSEIFDSYITTILKSIFSQVRTPSDLIQAYGIGSALAIPDYLSLKGFLKNRDGGMFAHQLLKDGLDDNSILIDIEWSPLEYVVGKLLADTFEPNNRLPSYREIMRKKNAQSLITANMLNSELESTCDISALYPMVDVIRNRLNHYR